MLVLDGITAGAGTVGVGIVGVGIVGVGMPVLVGTMAGVGIILTHGTAVGAGIMAGALEDSTTGIHGTTMDIEVGLPITIEEIIVIDLHQQEA